MATETKVEVKRKREEIKVKEKRKEIQEGKIEELVLPKDTDFEGMDLEGKKEIIRKTHH